MPQQAASLPWQVAYPPTSLERLLGRSTQNAPCTGDGSDDPAELRVRIAADKIESKSGICNSLAVTLEGAFSHSQPPRESVGPIVNAVGHFGHRTILVELYRACSCSTAMTQILRLLP